MVTILALPPVLLVSAASFPNSSWGFSQKSFFPCLLQLPHLFIAIISCRNPPWHPRYCDAIKHLFLSLPTDQHTVPTILELLQVMSCFVACQWNAGGWDLFLWPTTVGICCSEEPISWLECCNFQIHHPLDLCRGKKCKSSGWSWIANDSFNQAFPMMDSGNSQRMSFREP